MAPSRRIVATRVRAPGVRRIRRGGLFDNARIDPGQQRDAGLECGDKVDIPVHRPAGNFGDLRADAEDQGQFVEHLVFDDRQFEVGNEQVFAPPDGRLNQDVDRVAANNAARGAGDHRRVRGVDKKIAGFVRCEPNRFGLDRQRRGDPRRRARKGRDRQRRRSR